MRKVLLLAVLVLAAAFVPGVQAHKNGWALCQNPPITSGSTVSGTVLWKATSCGTNGTQTSSIVFKVDGVTKFTDTSWPMEFNFNTATLTNGQHTFSITGTASDGHTTGDSDVVTVQNGAPPPPQCSDGINNDAPEDTLIDFPADPGCIDALDNSESPNPPPSGEPLPIAGQGYTKVFGDEFDTLDRTVWDDHIWYQPAAQPGAQSVESGVLHLRSFQPQGFHPTTMTTLTSARTWTRGYFEARMKWTQGGVGTWPAFWLLSYRHATDPVWPTINPYCANNSLPAAECWNAELDVMDEGDVPTTHFVGLHRNTSGGYGQQDQLVPSPNWFPQPVDLSLDWHTYSAEWTASQVKFYLDDVLVSTVPVFDSTNQPLFMLLQNWTNAQAYGSHCWACGTPTTDTDVQVDWVRIWQR